MAKDNTHDKELKIQRITGRIEAQLEAWAPALGLQPVELITAVGYLLFIQGPGYADQVPGLPLGSTEPLTLERPAVEVDDRSHDQKTRRASTRNQMKSSWTPARRKAQAERMRKMMANRKRKITRKGARR